MTDDMAGALRELEQAVSEARPRLMDAEALLIFYRRLVCDWSRYAEDVAALEGVMSQQLLSGEQAALFAVQTLVFPLAPHLHLFSAQSLASAASRACASSSPACSSLFRVLGALPRPSSRTRSIPIRRS